MMFWQHEHLDHLDALFISFCNMEFNNLLWSEKKHILMTQQNEIKIVQVIGRFWGPISKGTELWHEPREAKYVTKTLF